MQQGNICVVTGPSGVGKTTIVEKLVELIPNTARFITTTSRDPRESEVDGKDYYFMTREKFKRHIQEEEFLEWEENYGNYYGTSLTKLKKFRSLCLITFITVDTRGVFSIKKAFPEALTIFIIPKSIDELEQRLKHRNTPPKKLKTRLDAAREKIAQAYEFDYQVINAEGELDKAVIDIFTILKKYFVNP